MLKFASAIDVPDVIVWLNLVDPDTVGIFITLPTNVAAPVPVVVNEILFCLVAKSVVRFNT